MIVTLVHAGEILDIATEKPIQLKPYAWHEYFTPPLVEDPKTEKQ